MERVRQKPSSTATKYALLVPQIVLQNALHQICSIYVASTGSKTRGFDVAVRLPDADLGSRE